MQHINLVSQIERIVEPLLSARQQLWLLAVAAMFMLLVAAAMYVLGLGDEDRLMTLRAEEKALTNDVSVLQAKKAKLENNNTFDTEIHSLKRSIQFRRQLLGSIDLDKSTGNNFAEHLTSLARQHVEGMWFTEIHLHEGGQDLSLVGLSRKPEYLPRYLQKLAQESVFQGHQFRVFKMGVPEEQENLLSFELRSQGSRVE